METNYSSCTGKSSENICNSSEAVEELRKKGKALGHVDLEISKMTMYTLGSHRVSRTT
jgi:hypothetical protein